MPRGFLTGREDTGNLAVYDEFQVAVAVGRLWDEFPHGLLQTQFVSDKPANPTRFNPGFPFQSGLVFAVPTQAGQGRPTLAVSLKVLHLFLGQLLLPAHKIALQRLLNLRFMRLIGYYEITGSYGRPVCIR